MNSIQKDNPVCQLCSYVEGCAVEDIRFCDIFRKNAGKILTTKVIELLANDVNALQFRTRQQGRRINVHDKRLDQLENLVSEKGLASYTRLIINQTIEVVFDVLLKELEH